MAEGSRLATKVPGWRRKVPCLPTDGSGEVKVMADTADPVHFVIEVAGYTSPRL